MDDLGTPWTVVSPVLIPVILYAQLLVYRNQSLPNWQEQHVNVWIWPSLFKYFGRGVCDSSLL